MPHVILKISTVIHCSFQVLALPRHERDLVKGDVLASLLAGTKEHRCCALHLTRHSPHVTAALL